MARRAVSPQFRDKFSEKLMDLGNLTIAGLVIGQFLSGKEFSSELFLLGIILAVACYIISYLVDN